MFLIDIIDSIPKNFIQRTSVAQTSLKMTIKFQRKQIFKSILRKHQDLAGFKVYIWFDQYAVILIIYMTI